MAHLTDVVAYSYHADLYCPNCTEAIVAGPDCADLDAAARRLGIDAEDESTYDSGAFPKVVFRDQALPDDFCATCGAALT